MTKAEKQQKLLDGLAADLTKAINTPTKAECEYEAGYNAFMLRCMTYAAAHAEVKEVWTKYDHNFVDAKPVTPSYKDGYDDARSRILRETQYGFGLYSPREMTAMLADIKRTAEV
jgi:hypothetical protein